MPPSLATTPIVAAAVGKVEVGKEAAAALDLVGIIFGDFQKKIRQGSCCSLVGKILQLFFPRRISEFEQEAETPPTTITPLVSGKQLLGLFLQIATGRISKLLLCKNDVDGGSFLKMDFED